MKEETKQKDSFNEELAELQKKYGYKLYAANQVMENGEIMPLIKKIKI